MKSVYFRPDSQEISLMPRDGMLVTGSNEGYEIAPPIDPGFTSALFSDTNSNVSIS